MSGPLILASTSRYRRRLLEDAGIDHRVAEPDFDERALDGHLTEWGDERLAVEVARGKARSVVPDDASGGALVLAADQLAVLDDELLTKPGDVETAVAQLVRMSGREHRLVNGIVLRDTATGREWSATDVHVVRLAPYDAAAARAYVEAFRPLDCVGSYRLEDDAGLIESVEGGDASGIIGLPIPTVRRLLAAAALASSESALP